MSESPVSSRQLLSDLFPPSERWRLFVVLVGSAASALFEVVGVASILPFMAVVMDPSALTRYASLAHVTGFLQAFTPRDQLLVMGCVTGATIVLSNVAAGGGLWLQLKFVSRTKRRLSTALFDAYLSQPYAFHVKRDAPSLLNVMYADSEAVVGLVSNALQFLARLVVILALLALLLGQNPTIALWTITVLGGSYYTVYVLVRRKQGEIGMKWTEAQKERQQCATESLGGIKELIVLGRESTASRRFLVASRDIADTTARSELTKSMPRYLLEPIAFGGILATALYLVMSEAAGAKSAIPTLALYAFVGYRLLPALQQLFAAALSIKYSMPSLLILHRDWVSVDASTTRTFGEAVPDSNAEHRTASLRFEDVTFRYSPDSRAALNHVSFAIKHGESVGLVGRSGSGKTTLADMILGLFQADSGQIYFGDDAISASNLAMWRRRVGYVPQSVFLSNSTIAENIAFGVARSDIDHEAVQRAARLAQTHEFIAALPLGLNTVVGERGVKLSGGQRQRLGIARALYHEPDILIFDEATSALDGMTEDAVMQAIHSLSGSRTVILIAHRLRTVEACDRIILLEDGEVVAEGAYEALLQTSDRFRRLAVSGGNARPAPTSATEQESAEAQVQSIS